MARKGSPLATRPSRFEYINPHQYQFLEACLDKQGMGISNIPKQDKKPFITGAMSQINANDNFQRAQLLFYTLAMRLLEHGIKVHLVIHLFSVCSSKKSDFFFA